MISLKDIESAETYQELSSLASKACLPGAVPVERQALAFECERFARSNAHSKGADKRAAKTRLLLMLVEVCS